MVPVRRFMAQQVPVSPRIVHLLIAFTALLPKGKCHRTVRIPLLDPAYDAAYRFIGKISVFAPLQHKSPETQSVSFLTAS